MSTSTPKAEFIARLRRSLHVSGDDETRKQAVAARLAAHAPNLVPRRAEGDAAHRERLFHRAGRPPCRRAWTRSHSAADVPAAIADYLREPQPAAGLAPWRRSAAEEAAMEEGRPVAR